MPFGIIDTTYIDAPAAADEAYIRGLRTQAGVSVAELMRQIDARLSAYNGSLDAFVASLVTPTTEGETDPMGISAAIIQELGEHTLSRPQAVDLLKHALPLTVYGGSTEFTERYLERAGIDSILKKVDSLILGLRRNVRRIALDRLFSSAEKRVAKNSAVVSPGFAGSGTGDNAFPSAAYPDGSALPSGYTHYFAANTSTAGALASTVTAAIARLRRWHSGPFDMVASQAFLDLAVELDAFAEAGSALVRPAQGEREALVDAELYVGVLGGVVRVRAALTETTDPVAAVYKSYGALDERNPLAWRYDPNVGRGAILAYRDLYPLAQSEVRQEMGIGINDRTAAVLIHAADGATEYVDPTIS